MSVLSNEEWNLLRVIGFSMMQEGIDRKTIDRVFNDVFTTFEESAKDEFNAMVREDKTMLESVKLEIQTL